MRNMWIGRWDWGLFQVKSGCLVSFKTEASCSLHNAFCWIWVSWKYASSWGSPLLQNMSPSHNVGQGGLSETRWGSENWEVGRIILCFGRCLDVSVLPNPFLPIFLFFLLIAFLCFLFTRTLSYSTYSSTDSFLN